MPNSVAVAMEASSTGPPIISCSPQLSNETIRRTLLKKGVFPTPKIVHTLRKKQLQKSNRRLAKRASKLPQRLSHEQEQAIAEEYRFQAIKSEFRTFNSSIKARNKDGDGQRAGDRGGGSLVGKPWERMERLRFRELASEAKEYGGEELRVRHLRELSDIIDKEREDFGWLFEDDVELEDDSLHNDKRTWAPPKRSEAAAIHFLINRLSGRELSLKDYKFSKMMRHSGLQFTEQQLLKIVDGLGDRGQWKHALSVVEWIYNSKEHKYFKSRFVYTKLLAVLGKLRRPHEAIKIFSLMRGDRHIYPDMASYHSISVTLGQAGFLKELMNLIEDMRHKPTRKIKNLSGKNWDPVLQPDVVVFNAVLNACIPTQQWKGVYWVFEQLRKNGLKPNGATFGLAMEVMMRSGKYDLVHEFFRKMKKNGEAPNALTYKVLVKTSWEEGKVSEAIQSVRDMEQKGVIGTASVYYELACCLCYNGKWQEAIVEVEKLQRVPHAKPLQVSFTGMILSSMNGGHLNDCESIFEHSKQHCTPDVGMINAMLKVYNQSDMFSKAKELFEAIRSTNIKVDGDCDSFISPDAYTYSLMLQIASSALQWEYFEYIYQEMTLSGYPFDQSKHASQLVGASRAGKWHLLEHAFDAILEAGEIPNVLLFTELVLQAISQHEYGRALSLVNAMAHAPFQVSEQQWRELFLDNADRISMVNLRELQKIMGSDDLVMEASALSLSTILQYLCQSCGPESSTNRRLESGGLVAGTHNGVRFGDGNLVDLDSCENLQVIEGHGDDLIPANHLHNMEEEPGNTDLESGGYQNDGASMDIDFEFLADDLVFEHFADHSDNESRELIDMDRSEAVFPSDQVSESFGSNLPSADEILNTWKRAMTEDGVFYTF